MVLTTEERCISPFTRDGKPLRMRRYYFSETFTIIAAAEYSKASGDKDAMKFAEQPF